jgi:hypothetical protein
MRLGSPTTYIYDSMDPKSSRTDALGAIDNYVYDGNLHRARRQGLECPLSGHSELLRHDPK